MSYDLSFWIAPPGQPAPATFAAAAEATMRLASAPGDPDPKLVAFAEALREEVGEPESWPADPASAARSAPGPLLRIAMPSGDLMRAVDAAVRVAARHGVVVVDEQIGLAFLPDGRVLPEDYAAMWEAVREELATQAPEPTRAKMRPLLRRAAAGLLGPLGFKSVSVKGWDAAFDRGFPGGREEIRFQLENARQGGLFATLRAAISHDEVEGIHEVCRHPTFNHWTGTLAFGLEDMLGPQRFPGYPFAVQRASDLDALARIAATQVAPLLERCRDLRTLEELVNAQGLFDTGPPLRPRERFCNLIVTRLVGSPRWEETLQLVRARFAGFTDPERRELLEKLVDHLQSLPASAGPGGAG